SASKGDFDPRLLERVWTLGSGHSLSSTLRNSRKWSTSHRFSWLLTAGIPQSCRGFARFAISASATTDLRLRLPELPKQTRFSHCCRHCDRFGACWPDPLSKPNKLPGPSRLAATHP